MAEQTIAPEIPLYPNDDFLRNLWRENGGNFHGPNVETGTMPEAKLLPFLRTMMLGLAAAREAERNAPVSWRCFHCGEVFTDRESAAAHFGVQIDGCADDVACKLNATEGLLVKMLREAQMELRQYHEEDNAAFRQFYALGAEHSTAMRREEEKGYSRGLEDAKKHPETLGLMKMNSSLLVAANVVLAHFMPGFCDSRAVDDCLVGLAAAVADAEKAAPSSDTDVERMRDTLVHAGYTDLGAALWKPPLGSRPAFMDAFGKLEVAVEGALKWLLSHDSMSTVHAKNILLIAIRQTEAEFVERHKDHIIQPPSQMANARIVCTKCGSEGLADGTVHVLCGGIFRLAQKDSPPTVDDPPAIDQALAENALRKANGIPLIDEGNKTTGHETRACE